MPTVRVRPDVTSVVFTPTGEPIALKPNAAFDADDWVVKAHPWAFQTDADAAPVKRRQSIKIEQATAEPGELR
jgi:hypothetical protein